MMMYYNQARRDTGLVVIGAVLRWGSGSQRLGMVCVCVVVGGVGGAAQGAGKLSPCGCRPVTPTHRCASCLTAVQGLDSYNSEAGVAAGLQWGRRLCSVCVAAGAHAATAPAALPCVRAGSEGHGLRSSPFDLPWGNAFTFDPTLSDLVLRLGCWDTNTVHGGGAAAA